MAESEVSLDTPMMRQYNRIKREHADAVLFFRLGDFYEMFKSDAEEVSRLLGLTLTQRNGIPMCGIPYHASHGYIARLIRVGKKIAICEQTHVPESGKGLADRDVTEIITPGTVTDEDYLEASANNYIVALGSYRGRLSLAYLDISTGEFVCNECEAGESPELVRRELARLGPREALVQESLLSEQHDIAEQLESRESLVLNRLPDWSFDIEESRERLTRLFEVQNLKGFGIDDEQPAILACGPLLNYVSENAKSAMYHIRSIRLYEEEDALVLDEATQRNLELVRNMTDGSRKYSLLSVLDFTATAMGARLLRRWLLAPLRRVEEITRRQERVSHLYHQQVLLSKLREQLRQVLDLERLTARVALQKAHPKDLIAIRDSIAIATEIAELLGEDESELRRAASAAEPAVRELSEALQDVPAVTLHEGGIIRDGYHEELDELRSLKNNSQEVLESYLQEEREQTGISNLKVRYNKILGHFFEVTKGHVEKVPSHFIRRQSLVNAERFSTERLADLESKLNSATERIIELERQLFTEVRQRLGERVSTLLDIAHRVAELDALQSLAWAATRSGFVQPELRQDSTLTIREARHPVVEAHLPPGSFVPNDLTLDESGRRFALITGPNMAGKSTFLRQTALAVVMAQIGGFVPAAHAQIGVVDRIFCRVGASDNLARGESTFLVEMNETANILRNATSESLVIMDEVGRGTSTNDGLAIAWAVCEYIIGYNRCRTLFATHFHALTGLKREGLFNLSLRVATQGDQIVFLKTVREGPANRSYGIEVARLAGLPHEVVARAREVLAQAERPSTYAEEAEPGATTGRRGADTASRTGGHANQGALFGADELILHEIAALDVENTTPLEALKAIARWQSELSEKGGEK
jgi:DNA mismatch repair protein MutS